MQVAHAGAKRELRLHPVDSGHVRVGDDLDRAVAGHEVAEPLERGSQVGVIGAELRRPRGEGPLGVDRGEGRIGRVLAPVGRRVGEIGLGGVDGIGLGARRRAEAEELMGTLAGAGSGA